jgi:predicted RNA-binding Zn-ribbon protein involved in translation (DUF1610 family)
MSTASEILDNMEENESIDMLVVACMAFTICSECGHVDEKEETLMDHPCQKCGKIVHCRRILFSTEERLLEMIFECYQSEKSNEICVLLFCALIEQHLLNLLKSRCLRLNIEWPVMELLLERYEKVRERLKLFERLTGVKMKEALAGQSAASVFTIYESLTKKRNGIAHGLPGATYAITKDDIKAAVNAAADSFSCFGFLHHNYCAIDSPPLPNS